MSDNPTQRTIHPRRHTSNWLEFQPTEVKRYADHERGVEILLEVENSSKQLAWRLTASKASLLEKEEIAGPVRKDYAGIYRLDAFDHTYCFCTAFWEGYYPVERPFLMQITALEPVS